LQNHITFGELSKQLGIDLEKDDAFKNIDAFKDINSKSLKDSIAFFKTIDSKLKIRDIFNFAKIPLSFKTYKLRMINLNRDRRVNFN